MAQATERWSDRRLTENIDGNWTATRAWDVVAYTSENDAVSACGVNPGDSHPRVGYLKCTHIGLVDDKLTMGKVVATYEITSINDNPISPTMRQPFISWKWGKCAQPVDTDLNGNAILNSAFDAFRSNSSRNFSVRYLTITRYEPYYDQAGAETYTDTVCNGPVSFEGNTFAAGQVYCLSIAPVEEYQEGCSYVKIAYSFEIRTPRATNLTTLQKRHPFQLRLLDQGLRCHYSHPTLGDSLGPLVLADGTQITRDVLLDGTGKPIDTNIKAGLGGVSVTTQTLPATVLVDKLANNKSVFLIYFQYPETDFNSIGVND